MYALRPRQSEGKSLILQGFSKHKRILYCAPTGSGKTITFSDIAWSAFLKGKSVMIITHRKELLSQASKTTNCEIVMVETLNNRIKNGYDVNEKDLWIIDECHIGNFEKILEKRTKHVLGCTATPLADPSLSLTYNDIVFNVDTQELIADGLLSKPKTFVKTAADISELKISKGEYTAKSLDVVYNKSKVFSGMVDDYVSKANGIKSIVFCSNVETTINCFTEFKSRSVNVFMVHSDKKKMTEKYRDEQIKLFHESTNGVLVNCGICTTGFDSVDTALVILYRATTSLILYLQMSGRGGRIIDEVLSIKINRPVKRDFMIWDYGGNVERHGFWEQPRDWRKIFFNVKKDKPEQAAPVKECEVCRAMVYASAKICPFCGNAFPKKSIIMPEGELKELIYKATEGKRLFDLSYDELLQVANLKKWKNGFVERVLYWKEPIERLSDSSHGLYKFWNSKNPPYKQGYRDRKLMQFEDEGQAPANFIIKKS